MPQGLANQQKADNAPQFYELGQFEKARTQYDGVTHDQTVNYLKMTRENGVRLPVMSTNAAGTGSPTDFTVMLWFKFNQPSEGQDIMQLFSFPNSAACFITSSLAIMCDDADRTKLQISTEQIKPGLWFHLTLSIPQSGAAFLLLQNNSNGIIARDVIDPSSGTFLFVQDAPSMWQACLGDCSGNLGLDGGIREVIMLNSFITEENAVQAKNMQFTYSQDFKAYFRFKDNGRFERDEFVDRTWASTKPANLTDYIGLDLIPNDVCPTTYDQKKYIKFKADKLFSQMPLAVPLVRDNYEYSFSMTFKATGTPCYTKNPTAAAMFCNVILVDEVFMVYFETINMMKVYFFASKNYYESASKAFFVPTNQWVTLQLTLSRFNGFDLAVADQNGLIFYRQTESGRNMQSMIPGNKASLFDSFSGFVDHLMICPSAMNISRSKVKIDRKRKDCIFNLGFSEDAIKNGSLPNIGSNPDLALNSEPALNYTLYQGPNTDTKAGTFAAKSMFDGIACNDGHMTMQLQDQDSYFRFNTPSFDMWQSESTIEFWFKISDKSAYTSQDKVYLLSMRDSGGKYPYYEVYVQNGVLTCAPFGSISINDVRLSFSQFSLENEDTFGWWHVTCSYSFQKQARATLFNTNVNAYQTVSLSGQSSFYPQDSLFASFGLPAHSSPSKGASGLLIKEVRYWSVQLTQEKISMQRYRQIDPTRPENTGRLLTYLRLASGDLSFMNFADLNRDNRYVPTNFQFNGLTFVPEFFQTISYYYDVVKAKVLQKAERTYHTVCPLYTYYLDRYCYSEPINQLALTIFPSWNAQTKSVDWELSVLNSSAIDTSIILSLNSVWQTNDSYLQQLLESKQNNFNFVLPGSYLRHESEYEISVSLTNEQSTFTDTASVKFVPSKCKWYTVSKGDAKSSYQRFGSPGTADIRFDLDLQTNSAINCNGFSFFDQVADIGFQFMLMDTNEYITVAPDVQFTVGDKGKITIIVPAAEQTKLPLFKDIQILATLRWRNSALGSDDESLAFQSVMITLRFEPTDSVLVGNLIASSNEVTRGETLILDATSSYITNVPQNMKTRGISFEWICPNEFKSYCQGQTDGQLVIPFSYVASLQQKNPSATIFKRAFLFTAVISWDKPNSNIEVDKLSSQVMFWDITAPQFEITYSPQPVLITDVKNTVFTLASANFDVNNLQDYNIDWTISPPLTDMSQATVLRSGALYQINKGAWSANTEYTVNAEVSHKALANLRLTKNVQFRTEQPPTGGIVIVSPQSAKLGQEITVSVDGWTSNNPPVVFNVYGTLDSDGQRRGLLLNVGAPVSDTDKFKFVLKDSNPVQVEVTDQSKESVQFIETFQIVSNAAADSSSTPDQLLTQLRKSTDATEKVNLIDKVLEKSLQSRPSDQPQQTFLLDTSSQILIRQSLLQAIADQIKIYSQKPASQDMTVEDFILKTVPLLQSATSVPEFIDQKTALMATSVIDQLALLKDGSLANLVESDQGLRTSYIRLIQNMNAIARTTANTKVQGWVNDRVADLMDNLCSYSSLEQGYKSPASPEFEFQLYQFDRAAAMQGKKASIQVLDSQYDLSATNLYSQYPNSQQPGLLCAQVLSIKGGSAPQGRILTAAKLNAYSQGVTSVSIYEVNSGQKRDLGELTGSIVIRFDVVPDTYKNNQTVCMGFSKDTSAWDSNLCNSELEAKSSQMKCTCNAFKSDLTALFTDSSRPLDPTPIVFPEVKQPTKQSIEVQPSLQARNKSYIWLWSCSLLSFVLLVAAGIAFRLDIADNAQTSQKLGRTQNAEVSFGSSNGGLNHFILEVSRELHQPYAEVDFRRKNLVTYRNVCPNSVFVHTLSQIHPAVAPFISYFATQSRLFRFSAYALQINIFAILVSCYFSRASYRLTSIRYDDSVIDQADIKNIAIASVVGSLVLLPFISEPVCTLLSDAISKVQNQDAKYMDEIQVEVRKRRVIPRGLVIVLGLLSTLVCPIWAGVEGRTTPSSNQFCILTSLMGGLILSIFVTSNLYVAYNSVTAKLMQRGKCGRFSISNWFVCHKALRIAQDLKAVQEASKLFTLSDVLPSSLENSQRSIVARRVSTSNNKTESDKESDGAEQMMSEQTGRDKYNQQSELSNANVEDSLTRHPSHPNAQYQVRNKRGRLQKVDPVSKVNLDEISGNSLTYTEYKAKLGVVDTTHQSRVRQNNYINRRGSSDSSKLDGASNATSIACNEQERSQQESSQAEYMANERSRSYMNEEISHCISQNVSFRPDVSRNDILPVRGIGSESSASAHSEFSDIRGLQIERSMNSSLNQEARVHAEPKQMRL